MFRLTARALNNAARGIVRQTVEKRNIAISSRLMAHNAETDEEFDARYEAYFNRPDIDGWEVRKAMNDLSGMDVIPDPIIIIAALKACRRLNDFALAVRILEIIHFKSDGAGRKDILAYLHQEIKPTLDELGIDTLDKIGYEKPELALQSVYDIH